jgi:hypothetical protein
MGFVSSFMLVSYSDGNFLMDECPKNAVQVISWQVPSPTQLKLGIFMRLRLKEF